MMMKILNWPVCITLTVLLMCAVETSADITYTWVGTTAGRDWLNTANWSPAGQPIYTGISGSRDYAYINTLPGVTLHSGIAGAWAVEIGNVPGAEGRVNVYGGSLNGPGGIDVASIAGGIGTLNVYGGDSHSARYLCPGFRGNGTLNMYKGCFRVTSQLRIGYYSTAAGLLNLDGGTISAASLYMPYAGSIAVKDGVLLLDGDNVSTVQGYITAGKIHAAAGYDLVLQYNSASYPGKTALYARHTAPSLVQPDIKTLTAAEGAGAVSYELSLVSEPTADVYVRLESSPKPQIELNNCGAGASVTLHFSRSNWNVPQRVYVQAYDDLVTECTVYVTIHHTVCSADMNYHNSYVPDVVAAIQDNDGLSRNINGLPTVTQLPDPFLMNNGQRASTAREWKQRREEIKGILQSYQYGFMGREPVSWNISMASSGSWLGGMVYRYNMTLLIDDTNSLVMSVNVYRPGGSGPFPVIVNVGDDSSKAAVSMPRGYVLVTYNHEELDPDTEGYDVTGPAQAAYPEYDWGSICVWAWGASRVMDYLETRSDVDLEHVIVRGHSRTGKAALLAGAFDERFTMVAPNGAGTGGPSVYRIRNSGSETLASITSAARFYSWYQPDFGDFGNKETKLPFDQHWLQALVAPRLLLTTDAVDDLWANPLGNQAGREAARKVFDFMGADQHSGMHFRSGQHDNLDEDWNAMIDFANHHFFGNPSTRNFDYQPYPSYVPGYSWSKPNCYVPEDLNKDGLTDFADFGHWVSKWLITGPCEADLTGNYRVNLADFNAFVRWDNEAF